MFPVVGKSALITSYVDNEFHESSHQTIGVDFKSKEIPVPPTGTPCKLQIWDIAGNVRFRTITTAYFRGSVIIYLVYDISDADSFNHITSEWLPLVRSNATRTVELMLIGNKCDVTPQRRVSDNNTIILRLTHSLSVNRLSLPKKDNHLLHN